MSSGEGSGLRSAPLLIRTKADLMEAVIWLDRFDSFVIDVETNHASAKNNEVMWIGLGTSDRVFLIPMGHLKGRMITPAYTEKRLPPEEERSVLKSGALSTAKKSFQVPATFGEPGSQLRQDEVFSALRPLLFGSKTKIGHNLKFDLESVAKYYGGEIPLGPYSDTLIMTHVINENLPKYDLKSLVMDWLRVPKKPEIRKAFYPNLGRIGVESQPLDEVARYLAKDVWYTHLYHDAYIDIVRKDANLNYTFWMEMQVYPVLMTIELTGIRIDVDLLRSRGAQLRVERQQISERIWDICGAEYAVSNPHKKRQYLFGPVSSGGQGLAPLAFTEKSHTPQLNTAVLKHYAPTNELARLFLEFADREKTIGTFIDGLEKRLIDNRLHTSFNQHRTVTGRLSSNNPNLQQIPRGGLIRDTFISDDDHVLVVADYDQIELRCAAYLSGDSEMIRVFKEGQDIHTQAAAAMYDIAPDLVDSDQRQGGKTMNFAALYGAFAEKIAATANCSVPQAEQFIRRYYAQFPGLLAWKEFVVMMAKRSDMKMPYTMIPPWGRRRRLPELFSSEIKEVRKAERQVVNSIVQGFASNIMKIAMVDLHRVLADTPFKLLLNVHDELILQAPKYQDEEAQEILVKTLEAVQYNGGPILGEVPLTAAAGVAHRWSEAKGGEWHNDTDED